MNASNKSLFYHSYKEVLEDLDIAKERLAQARHDNDAGEIALYNNLHKKFV